jgi:hypothetical protein
MSTTIKLPPVPAEVAEALAKAYARFFETVNPHHAEEGAVIRVVDPAAFLTSVTLQAGRYSHGDRIARATDALIDAYVSPKEPWWPLSLETPLADMLAICGPARAWAILLRHQHEVADPPAAAEIH